MPNARVQLQRILIRIRAKRYTSIAILASCNVFRPRRAKERDGQLDVQNGIEAAVHTD